MNQVSSLARHRPVKSKQQVACTTCGSKKVVRRGYRKKKLETLPLYLCKSCGRTFTKQVVRGKTYPIKVIFEALSLYHLGYSLSEVTSRIKGRFGTMIKKSTLGGWVKEFRELCTYSRLRERGSRLFTPNQVLYAVTLYHKQVYRFCYHRAKLQLLLELPAHQRLKPLKEYLEGIASNCPHELFQGETRSSLMEAGFSLEQVQIREKANYAVRLAQLALQAAPNNRARHATLQRFMLANDSVTVAVEVPVYLTPEDVRHLQERLKFDLPFKLEEPLSGHIDFVQIRNNVIHLLDYKPGAKVERRALEQLTFYALALSRRTGLRLFDFKCAWFDADGYFEFFPLHVVYKIEQKG